MTGKTEAGYPIQYETEVLLKDGSRILIRPIRRDDTERWLSFVSRLSDRTKYRRFHSLPRLGPEEALRFCTVDYVNAFAFVAETIAGQTEKIVAIGRYHRLPDKHAAEVAFVVEDAYQGKGIGTKLVEWLAEVARDNGIRKFEADVLDENRDMMTVFTDYGFHVTSTLERGVHHLEFPISRTRKVVRKEEARERSSTLTSLRYLLSPRSIAVIGASRKPGSIGQVIYQCIMQNGFSGVLYPVNPNADSVMSVKAYPSVLDVPGHVDLAMIVVPAPLVARVADECGRKGVRSLVVISDGFKERDAEGATREMELREIILGHGMRLVGPNCMGVINTAPDISLNGTFSQSYPPPGNIAFLSQSGALGVAILDYAKNLNMGISSFVSVGNRADISANDLLQYWEHDEATDVILLYLESFGNPREFVRIARRLSASKPIVAVKSGRTIAGSRAASSHTGALATPEIASEALFGQAGIIRVNMLAELFDVAALLSNQPLPKGKRVVIVTNGGGPGILAADACEYHGLALADFSAETTKQLKEVVERDIPVRNPLDMTAGASEREFQRILKVLAGDAENDAVIAIFVPPTVVDSKIIEDAIRQVAPVFQRHKKPLLSCILGQHGLGKRLGKGGKFVPCYPFPEDAVSALARAVRYSEWLRKPKGVTRKIPGLKQARARNIIESAMTRKAERPLWLSPPETAELLDCYKIRFAKTLMVKTAAEARGAASRIGFPLALKLASSTITHKTDYEGVKLDLKSEDEVERAYGDIRRKLAEIGRENEMEGVVLQPMVKEGIEAIVGVTQDPSFGSLIMFGLGGIFAEMAKDVAVRLHPLTDLDAKELIGAIKMAKLFDGFRGSPPSDTEALEDLLLRLSALVEDIPQIAELDFNPVKVLPRGEGYMIVDARILLV
ncbi:MAG: bifunctional GNAT family N-acetyltransferase/acetate--CoA ligase family protein [Pseudomonadota bacterium]